jgi:hypothetical protein
MALMNLRRRPSGRSAIVADIPVDAILPVIGRTVQNGGTYWVQVRFNDLVGWIPFAPVDQISGDINNVPIR